MTGIYSIYEDRRLETLFETGGVRSLGLWYYLVCVLRAARHKRGRYNKPFFSSIAGNAGVGDRAVKDFIDQCIELRLLIRDGNILFLSDQIRRTKIAQAAANRRWSQDKIETERETVKEVPAKLAKHPVTVKEAFPPEAVKKPSRIKLIREKMYAPFKFLDVKEVQLLWKDFVAMRRLKKKPMTLAAEKRRLMELERLSKGDIECVKYLLIKTTDKTWDQFYEDTAKEYFDKQPKERSKAVEDYIRIHSIK